MSQGPPHFPSPHVPEDGREQKLLGLYPQRQEGLMLQRVRVPGGRLTSQQLAGLADAAEKVGARGALHLTTRQDIEIHGLAPEAVPSLQEIVAALGLTTVGSAGDTVRNSTVDPLGGHAVGVRDLMPLAVAIEAGLQQLEGAWALPRKFKMSFSGDERAAMRPWFSDVGVIADEEGTFSAVVAGSLGARPASGILFADALTAEEVAAVAFAAVRLFAEEGDRENRSKARLRHARQRLGDDAFLAQLGGLFAEERSLARIVVPELAFARCAGSDTEAVHIRLAIPHGDVALAAAHQLAGAAAEAGAEVRLGIEHDLYVFGLKKSALPANLAEFVSDRRVVACPGNALCSKAAGPTREAEEMLTTLAERHPELLFALSGCPNSCSHAAAAGIGITSRMKRDGQSRNPVFHVSAGGQAGNGPRLGETVASDVPLADLARVVEGFLGKEPIDEEG